MTDPGAPPLNPTLQQLEAVLRGIEERLPHEEDCIQFSQARFTGGGHEFTVSCNCGHAARVRAEQARAVDRMIRAAVSGYEVNGCSPAVREFYVNEALGAAALRAGEEHQ